MLHDLHEQFIVFAELVVDFLFQALLQVSWFSEQSH